MKKCKNCFRYREDWRDAEGRRLEKNVSRWERFSKACPLAQYSARPRPNVKITCSCRSIPTPKETDCCKYWESRFIWNLKQWLKWDVEYDLKRMWCEKVRMPLGKLRDPVPLGEDYFGDPKCPHCGEMPYSYERCQFCGQRFLPFPKTENEENAIEVGKYTVVQASNNHVHVYKGSKLVLHAVVSRRLNTLELARFVPEESGSNSVPTN